MKHRWMILALTLALLLATALPASAAARLPEGFRMEEILHLYNDQLLQSFMVVNRTQAATKVAQYRSSSAQLEGDTLSFSSRDGEVVLSAWFEDGQPGTEEPAGKLSYKVGKGVEILDRPVLKSAFAGTIAQADGSANLNALTDWMNKSTKGGEALAMKGYTLTHERVDGGDLYELVADGLNKAEPTQAPKPEPTQAPKPEPTTTVTQAPKPEPTQAPQADADALLSWKGFEVIPLRTERWQFASGSLSLRLYVRVINNTPDKLTLRPEDMTVDGVSLPATSIFDIKPGTDTGPDSEESILIYVDEGVTDKVVKSILYGSDMRVKLLLRDNKNHEDVYMEKVRLDLNALPCERHIYQPDPNATKKPSATKAPAATKTPKKTSYTPLFEGDKGEDVRRMQRKLIDLGYLNDTADGSFGPKTAAAVREFCETNGLGSSSYASSAMLEKLYSGNAKAFQEPWVPLIFEDGAQGQWRKAKNDEMGIRVKATNVSRTKTIKAFEVYMYATDVWGDKVYGEKLYYGTTSKTIKPGKSGYTEYFLLPNRSQINKVWCGIKKVIFSDGTVRENSTVNYDSWTIRW